MSLDVTLAKIAREQKARAKPAQVIMFKTGVISAYAAGVATVTIDGSAIPAPHLAAYTPVVSDQVAVLLVDGSPLIFGTPTGFPTF
jgi:cytochrome c oxidase assembly factor CtaG